MAGERNGRFLPVAALIPPEDKPSLQSEAGHVLEVKLRTTRAIALFPLPVVKEELGAVYLAGILLDPRVSRFVARVRIFTYQEQQLVRAQAAWSPALPILVYAAVSSFNFWTFPYNLVSRNYFPSFSEALLDGNKSKGASFYLLVLKLYPSNVPPDGVFTIKEIRRTVPVAAFFVENFASSMSEVVWGIVYATSPRGKTRGVLIREKAGALTGQRADFSFASFPQAKVGFYGFLLPAQEEEQEQEEKGEEVGRSNCMCIC